jgi:hypothetical protein
MSDQTPALDTRIFVVQYDIRDDDLRQSVHDLLRPRGAKLGGSVFLIPGNRVPFTQLELVKENPLTISLDVIESQMSSAQVKAVLARDLDDYARAKHTALIKSLDEAAKRLQAATEAADAMPIEEAVKKYQATVRAALGRASKYLQAAIDAAMAFDESENLKDVMDGLKAAVESSKASVQATLAAYAATATAV